MRFKLFEGIDHKKYTQEEIQSILDDIVNDGYLTVWANNDFYPATSEPTNSPYYPYENEDVGEYRDIDSITIDKFYIDEDEDEDYYSLEISFTVDGCSGEDSAELEFSTKQVDNLDELITDLFDEIDTKYSLHTGSPFEFKENKE